MGKGGTDPVEGEGDVARRVHDGRVAAQLDDLAHDHDVLADVVVEVLRRDARRRHGLGHGGLWVKRLIPDCYCVTVGFCFKPEKRGFEAWIRTWVVVDGGWWPRGESMFLQ